MCSKIAHLFTQLENAVGLVCDSSYNILRERPAARSSARAAVKARQFIIDVFEILQLFHGYPKVVIQLHNRLVHDITGPDNVLLEFLQYGILISICPCLVYMLFESGFCNIYVLNC